MTTPFPKKFGGCVKCKQKVTNHKKRTLIILENLMPVLNDALIDALMPLHVSKKWQQKTDKLGNVK